MNCKQIREAIDIASRRAAYGDSITSHLSGCLDCRRHADDTSSLLMLLSAQPRVEAPADFDFRLRARIARAQAEQATPAGLLERLWENLGQTFSWGQAATAMAAVALIAAVSTSYINHNDGAPAITKDVAVVMPQTTIESAPASTSAVVGAVKPVTAKYTSRSVKTALTAIKYEPPTNVISSKDIASANNSPGFYSRETRQVVPNRNAFGAELVSVNSAKSAGAALTF